MPNPPKYVEHGALYLVTSRTEEGLPFLDSKKLKPVVEAIMARAQALYPVEIVAHALGANHLHQLLVPIAPEHLPLFVGYVKQELAHAVNRMNGVRKKTIWCDGYDSPILLGYEEALHYLSYCYTQAQVAYQADTIEDNEGATSWEQFMSGDYRRSYKRVYRTDFTRGGLKEDLYTASRQEHELVLSPYAWLGRLAPGVEEAEVKKEVIRRVRAVEAQCRKEREEKGIKLYTTTSAERASSYVPKKFGKRMICICWDVAKRVSFLGWVADQLAECRRVWSLWRQGDRRVTWPVGFFSPGMPSVASLLPVS